MGVSFDVAVIGGGITGLSAALAAQHRGASVCLLRGSPGATALTSGAWSGPLRTEVREALSESGFLLTPAPQPLPHQRGDLVKCDFAASSHVAKTDSGSTVVCGVAGLGGFNAYSLARLWERDSQLSAAVLHFDETPAGGWASAALASFFERSPDVLVRELKKLNARHFILPPVLGMERGHRVVEHLAAAGFTVTEALATTPSIPGWRLLSAIDRVLAARRITTLTGRATLEVSNGARVESIRHGNDVISARSFVLASGKFMAGGITATDAFTESVFALPVWLEHLGDVFSAPDPLPLTDPVRSEPQPLLFAGLHTDEMLRPVNRSLDVVYNNVFAAGTIRAGWNLADSGLGHCADDGWNAGLNATA